jgi:hypothetical protein
LGDDFAEPFAFASAFLAEIPLRHRILLLSGQADLTKLARQKGRATIYETHRLVASGDVTGFSLFNAQTHEFEFRFGPVFSEILLS